MYSKLLGTKESPGVLKNIYRKLKDNETVQESDIRNLIEAAEGTSIRIFPRDNSKS